MVTRAYIARSAMNAYRMKGTAMARVMLRALGIDVPSRMPSEGVTVSYDAYTEIRECFANHGLPMDGLMGSLA